MANEKIFIEVEVDDKGARARVTDLDKAIDGVTQRAKQASPALDGAGNSAARAGTAAGAASMSWSKMASATFLGVSANQAATAAFNAVWSTVSMGVGVIGSAIAASQKYTNAFMGLRSISAAFGHDLNATKQAAIELSSDGLMTVTESAEGLKNLLATRFELPQAINLMKAFKDSAAFGRQGMLELGQAVVGATQGIKNQMSQMVDNSGVTKNLTLILKENGFSVNDLARVTTDARVRLALYNGIMKETAAQTGDATRLSQTYTGQISKLNTSWTTLLATYGSAITENKTVAEALGFVTTALNGVVSESTNQGNAFKWVSEIVIFFIKVMGEASTSLNTAISVFFDTKIIIGELSAALTNLGGMFQWVNERHLTVMAAMSTGNASKVYTQQLAEARAGLKETEKSYNEQTEAINRDHAARDKWIAKVAEGGERLKQLAVDLERTKGLTVEYGTTNAKVADQIAAADEKAGKAAAKAASEKAEAMHDLLTDIQRLDAQLTKSQEVEDKYWKEWAKDAREARFEVEEQIHAIDMALQGLADRRLGQMDPVSQAGLFGTNFTTDPSAGREASVTFATSFKEGLREGLADVADIVINTIVNGGNLRQGAVAVASKLGSAIGGSVGMFFGGPVGAALGSAIGSLAGPALDKMIGIFSGPSAEADIKKRVKQSWGVALSDGLTEAIASLAKKVGRQAAEILSIDKILGEAGGLNAGNLQTFTAKFRDVFVMFETGAISSAQATEVLNKNWDAFAKAHTDSSGRISAQMKEMIQLARNMGLEVQAINDYLWDQAKVAIEGSNAIIAGSTKQFEGYTKTADAIRTAQEEIDKLNQVAERGRGVEWSEQMAAAQQKLTASLAEQHTAATGAKDELANLGVIAVATYAAAIASGMSHASALKAASPGLSQLQKAYADLGLNIEDAGLKALIMQNQLLTKNPSLIAGIDGLSQSFIALSNMGLLNEETFRAMEKAGASMYDKLLKEAEAMGGSAKDALVPMQEYLHRAEEQAKLLGIPLDANTQAMIDQSKALGIWKDKGKDANAVLLDGLKDIVEAMREMIGLLRSVPPEVNSRVTVTRTTVDEGGGGGQVFHSGGLIRGGQALSTRISDVNITAQSGEYVVSRKGVSAVGVRALEAINQGRPGDAGVGRQAVQITGDVHVSGSFESDDDAAEAIGRAYVRKMKARGVKFGRRRYS